MTSAALICAAAASFLVGGGPRAPAALPRASRIIAAIDYKDPAVAAEFQKVQERPIELVEAEIEKSGVPVPPSLNEMDMRLMLVELRMRKAGTMPGGGKAAPKKPASYGSKYEEALWEKPAFKRLIDDYRARGNTNALNLATEYLNSPRQAADRYAGTGAYDETVAAIDAAMSAKVEQQVTSGRVAFGGFPASMGEAAIRMTLEGFGSLASLSVDVSDDGLSCRGAAEFETVEAAKACIDKYDGVDMGLGTTLEFKAL